MPAKIEKLNEKADGFAAGDLTAEDLIASVRAARSSDLKAALLLDRDEEATEALDWSAVGKALDIGKKEEVIDASVRGDYVVAVIEEEDGRTRKEAVLSDDVKQGRGGKKSSKGNAEQNAEAEAAKIIEEAEKKAAAILEEAEGKAREAGETGEGEADEAESKKASTAKGKSKKKTD